MKPAGQLILGRCEDVLAQFPDDHFTAVVTDPPYGLSSNPDMYEVLRCWQRGEDYVSDGGFMNREWDSFVPGPNVWKPIMQKLQSGGRILSFSGTRTYDLMVAAMNMAGNELGCGLSGYHSWTYGSGFPKSHSFGKGDEKWEGYGTALKPAHEPIAEFQKGKAMPLTPESLFHYISKPSSKERNKGCKGLYWKIDGNDTSMVTAKEWKERDELLANWQQGNIWPTVKPIELMRRLIRLVK